MAEIDANGGMGRGFGDAASTNARNSYGAREGRQGGLQALAAVETAVVGYLNLTADKTTVKLPSMPQIPGVIAPKNDTVV